MKPALPNQRPFHHRCLDHIGGRDRGRRLVFWEKGSEDTKHGITYQVSGSAAEATVIYLGPDGHRDETVSLPWSSTFRMPSRALSLVGRSTDGSAITCVISEDRHTVTAWSGPDCALQATS